MTRSIKRDGRLDVQRADHGVDEDVAAGGELAAQDESLRRRMASRSRIASVRDEFVHARPDDAASAAPRTGHGVERDGVEAGDLVPQRRSA